MLFCVLRFTLVFPYCYHVARSLSRALPVAQKQVDTRAVRKYSHTDKLQFCHNIVSIKIFFLFE